MEFDITAARAIYAYWPYAEGTEPRRVAAKCPVPLELWIKILVLCCTTFDDEDGPQFEASRNCLRRMWVQFRLLIDKTPEFWQYLTIDSKSTVDTASHAVTCVKSAHITMVLDLHLTANRRNCPTQADRQIRLLSLCLAKVAMIAPQWRALTLVFNDDRCVELVRRLPRLEMKSLAELNIYSLVSPAITEFVYYPACFPDIIEGPLSRLTSLCLVSFSVEWSSLSLFASLRFLELRRLPRAESPTSFQLMRALASARFLEHLIFGEIGVYDSLTEITAYSLPSLATLDIICLPGNTVEGGALMRVLSHAKMPMMTTMKLLNCGHLDLAHFDAGFDFLENLRSLTLGGFMDVSNAVPVLGRLCSLEMLDITEAEWLHENQFTDLTLGFLPQLKCLSASSQSASVIGLSRYVRQRLASDYDDILWLIYGNFLNLPLTAEEQSAVDEIYDSVERFIVLPAGSMPRTNRSRSIS